MKEISRRKDEHIKYAIESRQSPVSAGFERYSVVHNSFPEMSLNDVDVSTEFLGVKIAAPIMISALTGGTQSGFEINKRLARAAGEIGIPMCLGSSKIVFKHHDIIDTFKVRRLCPNVPLIANLGIAEVDLAFTLEDIQKHLDELEADAIMFHINPLHEALQGNSDLNFRGVREKLARAVKTLRVPVLAKEVGHGISAAAFHELEACGVAAIDIAGAGGTDWAEIEMHREPDYEKKKIYETFRGWGTPTVEILEGLSGKQLRSGLIVSGGVRTGADVFKCLAFGAATAGVAKPFLELAAKSGEALRAGIEKIIAEFKLSMFSAGCGSARDINTKQIKARQC